MLTATTTIKSASSTVKTDKNADNKFDLNNVKVDELPEELRAIVKGFQADYTKKTQAISDKEKTIVGQEDQIQRGKDWDSWHAANKDSLAKYNEYAKNLSQDGNIHPDNKAKGDDDTNDGDGGDSDGDLFTDDTKKVKKELQKDIGQVRTELAQQKEDHNTVMQTGMDMMVSLMKVVQESEFEFKIDPKRVIDHARKEGIIDMDKAVSSSYYKEIRDAEIKKGIEDGVAKEKEKLNLDVVSTDGTSPGRRKTLKVLNREKK